MAKALAYLKSPLAWLGNVTVAILVVYTLASHGILEVWVDQSGMGLQINSVAVGDYNMEYNNASQD